MSSTMSEAPEIPESVDNKAAMQDVAETEITRENTGAEETNVIEEINDTQDMETEASYNTNSEEYIEPWIPEGSFPFLRLPIDLRLLIYLYFIPNATVHMIPYKGLSRSAVREDGTPCTPALLQVCHQVYRELFDVWYSHAIYVAMVNLGNLVFLDHTRRSHDTALPRTLFAVRKLTWLIRIPPPKDDGWQTTQESVTILENYFSGLSTDKRPQTLHLQFRLHPDNLIEFTDNQESFLGMLEEYFRPLRKLVGVVEERTADMQLWWDNPSWEEETEVDQLQRDFLAMMEKVEKGLGMQLNPPIVEQRCGVCNVLMTVGQECAWRTDEE